MVSERRSDPASSVAPDPELARALKRLGAVKEKDPTYHEVLHNSRAASAAIRELFHGATLKSSSGYKAQQALRNEVMKDQRKLFTSNGIPPDISSFYASASSASELGLESPGATSSDSSAPPRRHRRSTSGAMERSSQEMGVYQVDLSPMQRARETTPSRKPASTSALQPPSTPASPNRMNFNFILSQTPTSPSSPPPMSPQGSCSAAAPTLYSRSHDLGNSSNRRSSLGVTRPSSSRPSSTSLLTPGFRLSGECSSSSLCSADSPGEAGPKPRPFKSSSVSCAMIRNAAEQSKRPDLLLYQLLLSNQGNSGRSSPLTSPKATERRTPNLTAAALLDADAALQPVSSTSAGQLSWRLSQPHPTAAAPGPTKQHRFQLSATKSSPLLRLQP